MAGWPYFAAEELRCRCGECGSTGEEMDARFMVRLVRLREAFGRPMPLTSAYRCPAYNERVSSTGRAGPHTRRRAVDVRVAGEDAYRLVRLALEHGFTGIGVRQHGPWAGRFVHLDDLQAGFPRPRLWSYGG